MAQFGQARKDGRREKLGARVIVDLHGMSDAAVFGRQT
jgi:hypothetical protein